MGLTPYLFMKNKLQRQIDWGGSDFTFTHTEEDKYHRDTNTTTVTIRGLYHESAGYQSKQSKEGTVISKKPTPMITCLFDDGHFVNIDDKININGKDMFVTGIDNVQNLNVVLHISLEVNE